MSQTFNGTPAQFIAAVLSGTCPALSAVSVGATSTTYEGFTADSPRLSVLVGVGNSLTLDYWDLMGPLLATSQAQHPKHVWSSVNQAVGSTQTPTFTTLFTALSARLYNPLRTCVLQFCELTNHIGAGNTFATVRDAAITYCNTVRAAGWKLAFHIPTPRAERATPGYEASASAWQVGQLAIYDQVCNYFRGRPLGELWDFPPLDLPMVPELADPYNTTFYLADGCHNPTAGINAKAAAVAAYTAGLVIT